MCSRLGVSRQTVQTSVTPARCTGVQSLYRLGYCGADRRKFRAPVARERCHGCREMDDTAADLCYHLDTGHLNQGVGITQAPDQRTDRDLNGPNLIIATCPDSLSQNVPSWIVSPSIEMVS